MKLVNTTIKRESFFLGKRQYHNTLSFFLLLVFSCAAYTHKVTTVNYYNVIMMSAKRHYNEK